MAKQVEVLFSCDASDSQLSCTAWDFRHNTNLMTYKGGGIVQRNTFCQIRGEYILSANSTKPLLHAWPINSQEQVTETRFVVPGRVNAMSVSSDGVYLVASIGESIYIWNLPTGRMLNTISKHYQTINCLKFTSDGSHFVSAGQDGAVLVWNLTRVVSRDDDNQTPLYSFNDHGLPVTDMHIGIGDLRAYMTTVSLDRTCKIYDLSSGILLLSVVFTEALKCVKLNGLETCVYVGTTEGNIYEFHIDAPPRTKEYHAEMEHTNKFCGHKPDTAINCLVLSVDGHTLISGGADQLVIVWSISSRQLISTIQHKGAITSLKLFLTVPTIFYPENKQPNIFMANLRRMIDPPESEENEFVEVLVTEPLLMDEYIESSGTDSPINLPSTSTGNDDSKKEIEKLRLEVQKLKQINKKLFEASAEYLLKS